MKGFLKRAVCLVLAVMLVIPMTFDTASAASKPKLNKTSKTLYGIGATYTLTIKNEPASSKLTWSSSDNKVATINALGQVTAMKKGNCVITCLITYPDKSVTKLTCKITVKVPATAVTISNSQTPYTHTMVVGESFDFNRKITPSNSSDKSYWVVEDEDLATVDSSGIVTAVKKGETRLQVRSGANKAAAMDPNNTLTHSIVLMISEPVAQVTSVEKTDDRTLTIKFSAAMNRASLINASGTLNTGNVRIEGRKVNNVTAADLGVITPSLSTDGMIMTVKTSNKFDGVYSIKIESDTMTQSGITFKGYDNEVDYTDNIVPKVVSYGVDDTGFVANIVFNKEIDISKMTVSVTDNMMNPTTKIHLTNVANYTLKSDKKTIQVDLSYIATTDYNKAFTVTLSGITDLKGNFTQPYNNEVPLYTDTSQKPNATLSYVKRTSRNTISAYFSKSIQYAGNMTINNSSMSGTVDSNDKTCVNYIITDSNLMNANTTLTGTVSGWYSYNTVTPANAVNFQVDMSVGATAPTITGYHLYTTLNNSTPVNCIEIAYNKNVTLASGVSTGVLDCTYRDANSNVGQYTILYSASVKDNIVTLTINPDSTLGVGIYSITLPANFVYDSFLCGSEKTPLTLSTSGTSTSQFPAPNAIVQDKNNPSIINISFPKKVDLASAQTASNYTWDTVHPSSAYVTNNSDAGATVQLTFAAGTLKYSSMYPVVIENVSGYSGSYQPMAKYTNLQKFDENIPPKFLTARLNGTNIILTFDEAVKGTAVFNVYYNGSLIPMNSFSSHYFQDNTVVLQLSQAVTAYNLYITPMPANGCVITDSVGNPASMPSQIPVTQ